MFLFQAYLLMYSLIQRFDLSILRNTSMRCDRGIFEDTIPNPMPLMIRHSSMGEGLHEKHINDV